MLGEEGLRANTNDDKEFCRILYIAFVEALPALAVLAALAPSKEGVKVIKFVTTGEDGKFRVDCPKGNQGMDRNR